MTSEPPDSEDERSFEPILAASVVLGFVFGGVTMIAMFAMFHMTAQGWMLPLAKQKSWNPPILLVASAVVIVVAYVTLRRRGAVEVADRIFLGYVAAIAMAAGVEIAREMFFIVRDHVPQNLGVAMRQTHRPPAGGRSGFGQAGEQERGRGRATRVVVLQWSLGSRAVATRDPRPVPGLATRGPQHWIAPSECGGHCRCIRKSAGRRAIECA